MLKNASNQGGANDVTVVPEHTKSWPQMLVVSKAAFLENYLAVSTWILNGSSIKCHKKEHQPFSLSGVRFGSRAIFNNYLPSLRRIIVFSIISELNKEFPAI